MTTSIMLSDIEGLSVTLLEAEPKLGGIFRTYFTAPGFYYPSSREDMSVLDKLIGNKTIVDDFYTDLKDAIKVMEEKEIIKGKYVMGFDNYVVENERKIQNTYGLDLLGNILRPLAIGFAKLKIWLGSDFWYHCLYRILAVVNLVELSDQLKAEVGNIGIQVHYDSRVMQVEDGHVVTENGDIFSYDYLVFASGGTGGNPKLQKEVYGVELGTHDLNKINNGIALQCAREKGWSYNKDLFAWYAEAVELKSGGVGPVLFQPGPGVMTVNRNGKRVYNEKRCYNERGRVTLEEKELLLISDKNNIIRNTPDLIPPNYNVYLPDITDGKYIQASSIEDLGKVIRNESILSNLSDDFEVELLEQWERYHGFVESGVDFEFNRGNDMGEVLDGGDPSLPPYSLLKNKALAPIDEINLVAIRLSPSSLDTCSGPTIDRTARVQKIIISDVDGSETLEPVANVFATGNAAEAILGGHYNAPGVPISSGIVGAYRIYNTLKSLIEP